MSENHCQYYHIRFTYQKTKKKLSEKEEGYCHFHSSQEKLVPCTFWGKQRDCPDFAEEQE